jgi:biotin synthase
MMPAVSEPTVLDQRQVYHWLRETDPHQLEKLWQAADDSRRMHVGDAVHLRGLVEVSNHCVRQCHYCGIRAGHADLPRYRLTTAEVLTSATQARLLGYGTVVLQAGEDPALTRRWVEKTVKTVKDSTGLAVTLSLGERDAEELKAWKAAGADRYLMRFETSNSKLYEAIHPPDRGKRYDRVAALQRMRDLGYEVGSGILIGIPCQRYEDVERDLALFRELELDMIGIGPFIPHPDTPLGRVPFPKENEQVPNTEDMTYKVLALSRLVRPEANIPSTTALATLNLRSGRELGLQRGANVLMPNVTPSKYRPLYELYPAKACITETAQQCRDCLGIRLRAIGRVPGQGQGSSPSFVERRVPQNTREQLR